MATNGKDEALDALTDEDLRARYDPQAMLDDNVYNAKMMLEDGDGARLLELRPA